LGRQAVQKIDRVVTAFFCGLECFSHSADEPEVIQAVVFAGSATSFRGTCNFAH
jgi:hypothetical protein